MPLEDWRTQLCCVSPYYFWQWQGENCKNKGACKHTVTEFDWQEPSDLSRESVRRAICEAQDILREFLGYPVVPTWVTEEVPIRYGKYYNSCYKDSIRLRYGHVQAVGQEVLTYLGTGDVNITTPPNDACPDTFETSYQLTPQQQIDFADIAPDEIALFVNDALAGSPWKTQKQDNEIRPIYTEGLVGDTITVMGASWLMGNRQQRESASSLGRPHSLYNDNTFDPLWFGGEYPDGSGELFDSNYLPTIDFYRRTIDPCLGGKVVYEAPICSCGNRACGDVENTIDDDHCGCCEEMVFCIVNKRQGIVRAAPQDCCTTGCQCRCSKPLKYCISYLAYDCSRDWRPTIMKLATALLCNVCRCELPCIKEEQIDLSREDVLENGRRVSFAEQDAPWGTLAGQVAAWKSAKSQRASKAVRM